MKFKILIMVIIITTIVVSVYGSKNLGLFREGLETLTPPKTHQEKYNIRRMV